MRYFDRPATLATAALPAKTNQWTIPYARTPDGFFHHVDDGSMDLADYGQMLWRRKRTLAITLLLAVLLSAAVSFVQPRIFQAVASVEIQGVNDNFLNLRDIDPTAAPAGSSIESYMQTQVELLQEDSLIERVVRHLKLDQNPEFMPRPSVWGTLRQSVGLRPPAIPAVPYAVKVAKENVKIVPSRQGRVIRIFYDSRDPRLAADFANALVQIFVNQSVEDRWRAAQQIKEWLRPQLEELKTKLERSQAELQAYSRASGLTITGEQDNLAADRLRLLQAELAKAQAESMAKEPFYTLAKSGQVEGMPDSGGLREYDLRLADLRRQLADLESLLKPENYKVVRLKAQVDELEAARRKEEANTQSRVVNDYAAAQRREKLLADAYSRQAALVTDLSAKMIHYNTLKHVVDSTQQVYEAMLQKVSEAGVASAIRPSNIRLISPATDPTQPYKPNTPLIISTGVISALILGLGFVVFQEQTNRRICVPGDVAITPLFPQLGAIPAARRLEYPAARLPGDTAFSVERITWEHKESELSESFRAVLASILLPGHDGQTPRVLVFTSPSPGDGKTTVASNLAISLAEIKHRVLLIDGDMRRPRLHKVFDVANSWGLSDLLCEKDSILDLAAEQLASKTPVDNLYLLPSGPAPDGIFNRLYSPRMLRLLRRFAEDFDHVLIDAPPCLEFADARILGRSADGIILVFRANHTDKRTALSVAEQLVQDRIPIIGTVLNDWNPKASGSYNDYSRLRSYSS